MPTLSTVDWLILLLYSTTVLGIGLSLKPFMTSPRDYLEAGRTLPAWSCALALVAASLGAPEILTMGAAGAHYGLAAALWFALGAVPALVLLGRWLMPVFYRSGARTVPEYLRLRFGPVTGKLQATLFVAMALFTAGLSLYLMATVFASLHIFDRFFQNIGWYGHGSFALLIALSVLVVMAYLLQGGLAGTAYAQLVQLAVITAGLLPVVFLGLRGVGGLSGLAAIAPAATLPPNASLIALGLGFVIAAGTWCVDPRLVQFPLAARDAATATRAPLLAAGLRVLVPLLFIVPGIVAIGLPTPQSVTNTTIAADGAIIHSIDVVPPEAAAGHGLVPAILDPVTAQPLRSAGGNTLLNYSMALPHAIVHFLPTGALGLALAALLCCCMSGLAANVTAIGSVVAIDLLPASERRPLLSARLAAAAALLLAAGLAYLLHDVYSPVGALLLVFALVNAPLLAVVLLGVFWPRATGAGALAGLVAGFLAALACYGLTLPAGAARGLAGGWIAVLRHAPGELSAWFGAVFAALAASVVGAVVASLMTAPRPQADLAALVHGTPRKPTRTQVPMPYFDVRVPMGLMFLLMGAFLGAFGLSTRGNPIYSASLGLNVNFGGGMALLIAGLVLFLTGRTAQLAIEKQRTPAATARK